MATEKPPPSGEAPEQQDQSIKARKFQLFERQQLGGAGALRPFADYVRQTPPAPMATPIKASLWALAVLVALLFLAAMFSGRGPNVRRRHASLPADRPPAVTALAPHAGAGRA
jgi:hypothetical protein